ncbi:hypothetical protein ACQW5G_00575 [Fructilactobacillus sp. Tb1]|uniref:hypothetical protein n=1 Tax=Fructilactobacillus sp. Tb1 TaxID=3422304 RepID=UPI003D2E3C65
MFLGVSSGDWLQAGASFFGSVIAIGGIWWQVTVQNKMQTKSLKKQLISERKNNFDSAINVENYKYYVDLSSYCHEASIKVQRILNNLEKLKKRGVSLQDIQTLSNYLRIDADLFNKFCDKSNPFAVIQIYADKKHGTKFSLDIDNYMETATKNYLNLTTALNPIFNLISTEKNNNAETLLDEKFDDVIETFKSERKFYALVSVEVMETASNLIK